MLKLLAMEDKNDEMNSKEWDKLTSKIRWVEWFDWISYSKRDLQ